MINAIEKSVLFICGLHRSGTTLVEQYVQSMFEVSVLRAKVPQNEGQHLQDVYPAANKFGGPGRFAFAPEMNPSVPTEGEAAEYRNRLLNCWEKYIIGDEPVLCEKSPPNLLKINWLRAVFPGAVFLIVVRDPRAVAGATLKVTGTSLKELMLHWDAAHSKAIESFSDDCRIITYEGFCLDPARTLRNANLPSHIALRDKPRDIDPRFSEVKNSNAEYIEMHQRKSYGAGSWTYFSYDI